VEDRVDNGMEGALPLLVLELASISAGIGMAEMASGWHRVGVGRNNRLGSFCFLV
jgi:hypothetical protein